MTETAKAVVQNGFTTDEVIQFFVILAILVYAWLFSPYRLIRPLDKLPGTEGHDPRLVISEEDEKELFMGRR